MDLHIHTDCSDGMNTKEEIIEMAVKLNLDVIAFTDHDVLNTDYLNDDRIKVIAGIELSCKTSDDYFHILGLFPKDNCNFNHVLEAAQKNRIAYENYWNEIDDIFITEYAKKYPLDRKEYDLYKGSSEKIPGFQYKSKPASFLVEKGLYKDVHDAWDKLWDEILPDGLPKLPIDFITVNEAIQAIKKSGGIAIFAHPSDHNTELDEVFKIGVDSDIDGYECIHYSANEEERTKLLDWCRKNDLYITCGSDFHGRGITKKLELTDEEYGFSKIDL